MFFCPRCSNLLLVEATMDQLTRWFCQTCPYVCTVKHKLAHDVEIKKKELDDVMGGEDAWKNAETVEVRCVKSDCEGGRAFFQMFQTRSADEADDAILQMLYMRSPVEGASVYDGDDDDGDDDEDSD